MYGLLHPHIPLCLVSGLDLLELEPTGKLWVSGMAGRLFVPWAHALCFGSCLTILGFGPWQAERTLDLFVLFSCSQGGVDFWEFRFGGDEGSAITPHPLGDGFHLLVAEN